MTRTTLLGLLVLGTIAAAPAAALSPTEIVQRHEGAVGRADVDAMMADYADDAIVMQASGTVRGKPAIRALFTRLFPRNADGTPAAGAMKISPVRIWEEGPVGLVAWTMGDAHGIDHFLIRNNKIAVQAVFLNEPTQAK